MKAEPLLVPGMLFQAYFEGGGKSLSVFRTASLTNVSSFSGVILGSKKPFASPRQMSSVDLASTNSRSSVLSLYRYCLLCVT
jgi:hypothetical protein